MFTLCVLSSQQRMTTRLRKLLYGEPAAELIETDVLPVFFVINGQSTPVLVRKSASIDSLFVALSSLTGVNLRDRNSTLASIPLRVFVHEHLELFQSTSFQNPLMLVAR